MKRLVSVALLALTIISLPGVAEAGRTKVKKVRGTRVKVTVRPGFPIRRTLPNVVVRTAPVVRVAPRAYLAPVVFGAVVVSSLPAPAARVWRQDEVIESADGWTDFTMNVDKRGTRMLLEIDNGAAQMSFAEVVFDNGEAQVIDFNDGTHRRGVYSLLDFKDGRKIDHVRVVARSTSNSSRITLHLVS